MSPFRRLATFAATLSIAGTALVAASPPASAELTSRSGFPLSIAGAKFHWSSPAIGDLSTGATVVVGGMDGVVYGFAPNGGTRFATNLGFSVASSPAIGDINGDGVNEVVVGYGTEAPGSGGGVAVLNGDGGIRCRFDTPPRSDNLAGVFNSPALGDVDGDRVNDIVFGSFNDKIYAMSGSCGVMAQKDNLDTVWSAPALRDVDGDGAVEIFIGGDATASPGQPVAGGFFRSLEYDRTATLAERWVRSHSETFQGAAGFANLGGQLAVVTGSGADYCRNHDSNRCADASRRVWAFDPTTGHDLPGWPRLATHQTFLGGPAIGDVNGDGADDVVIASTNYQGGGGAVDAFLSGGGQWTFQSPDEIPASPVIADTTGGGTAEVLIGTNGELFVLRGTDGKVVQNGIAQGNWAHKSAAAVGQLDGKWVVATAGFDPGSNAGKLGVYNIPTPSSAPWPQYQKNARRLGSAPTDAEPIHCDSGYWLVAADGGVFSFGPQAPFHGSTGNLQLNAPIVGMAGTADRGGYSFVATDGGIFSFGNASFHGSAGDIPLNQPIVGMARRPQGDGYWLVASDGGIFAFGNAGFHGSMGGTPLNQPIVGIAAHPSGNGYWLVARDGGIFSFGDAMFQGSTGGIQLNQPIVGVAPHPSGNGYWFVASDGGVFSFGEAGFHGSTGDLALNKPVVGMRQTPSGKGYWFVATDGGIFAFGDAEFCGSTGNLRLNQPIVGMG